MSERAYVRDGAEIYRRSFAIIRAESDLARFNAAEEPVAVRIIHACGMPEIARDIVMSKSFAERARQALKADLALALDALAEQGTDPTCLAALITVVTKTYDRSDVASAYAQDLTRWRAFLAEDRPRSARVAEIRAYVDAHQDMVRASVGHAKLKATQQALEAATADLQGWLDDKRFIPPLGLTSAGLERLFHDLKTLHFSVMKAMPSGD